MGALEKDSYSIRTVNLCPVLLGETKEVLHNFLRNVLCLAFSSSKKQYCISRRDGPEHGDESSHSNTSDSRAPSINVGYVDDAWFMALDFCK